MALTNVLVRHSNMVARSSALIALEGGAVGAVREMSVEVVL